MTEIAAILEAVQKLSGVSFLAGFATMLAVILIANHRGIWVWGRDLQQCEMRCVSLVAEWQARCDAVTRAKDQWERITMERLASLEETAKSIARPHTTRSTDRQDG